MPHAPNPCYVRVFSARKYSGPASAKTPSREFLRCAGQSPPGRPSPNQVSPLRQPSANANRSSIPSEAQEQAECHRCLQQNPPHDPTHSLRQASFRSCHGTPCRRTVPVPFDRCGLPASSLRTQAISAALPRFHLYIQVHARQAFRTDNLALIQSPSLHRANLRNVLR